MKDDGWKYRGLSYFTRLNYNYNDKYMLMFTFRADGSSKYNDKWGYFPPSVPHGSSPKNRL